MRRTALLAAAIGALALGGCATTGGFGAATQDLTNVANVINNTNVTPQAVVIAANSVDALQDTATAYLRLPRCVAGGTRICRVSAATGPIKRTVLAMRSARRDLEAYLRTHPGSAPPPDLYTKVAAAVTALSNVIDQYNGRQVIAAIR
jgi:hypothetical protein